MNQSEKYIRQGLAPIEIVKGLEIALEKTKEILEKNVSLEIKDIKEEKLLNVI